MMDICYWNYGAAASGKITWERISRHEEMFPIY